MAPVDPMQLQRAEDRERAQLLGEYDVGKMQNPQLFMRTFTHDCDLRELRTEVNRIRYIERRATAIRIGRKVILIALGGMEYANKRWNPWKLALDGIKNHTERQVHEADSCLARLWLKYTDGEGQLAPELELACIVCGWVFAYHLTNSLSHNNFMQPAQIQRIVQNEDVMGNIIDQMADNMDDQYGAQGNLSRLSRQASHVPDMGMSTPNTSMHAQDARSGPSHVPPGSMLDENNLQASGAGGGGGGGGGLGGLLGGMLSNPNMLGGLMQSVMSQFNNQMGSFDPGAPQQAPSPAPEAPHQFARAPPPPAASAASVPAARRPHSVEAHQPPPRPAPVPPVLIQDGSDSECYTSGMEDGGSSSGVESPVPFNFDAAYDNRIRMPTSDTEDDRLLRGHARMMEVTPPATPVAAPVPSTAGRTLRL